MPAPVSPSTCRNCEAALSGPYCARCGQRDLPLRESFWRVLGRFAGEQLVLDSRMGRTLRPFLLRPGFLTREYNEGRRARYSAPLRLYLLMSLVLFLAIGARGLVESVATADGSEPEGARAKVSLDAGSGETLMAWFGEDSWVVRAFERQRERFEGLPEEEQAELFFTTAAQQIPTAMLLLLPVFALLLRVAFLRSEWLYAQHFVFVLHVHAFYYLAFLAPVIVPHWSSALLALLAIPTYFLIALRRAYGERGVRPWLRALGMLPIYLSILVAAVIGLFLRAMFAA